MRALRPTVAACLRSARLPALKALALVACLAACSLAASPQITAVRFWSLGEVTRVAIETDSETQYHVERIDSPERIFLDLAGVRRQAGTRGMQVIPVNDRLVKQIRIALAQPGVIRLVLDLEARADYSISQLSNPDRIMIELRMAGHGPPMPPERSVTGSHVIEQLPPEPPKVQPTPAPTPVPPIKVSPASALGSAAPTVHTASAESRAPASGPSTIDHQPSTTPFSTEPRASASGPSTIDHRPSTTPLSTEPRA
ncbi:MAG TPA: AMIN domain-containing protein, partial [Bryobacteraceae bacterium]|nr:AMIN domain-containing protein [Bryobacteraceae bacterium]